MAGLRTVSCGLHLSLCVALWVWGAEGEGNGRGKKESSAKGPLYLGQPHGSWNPLMYTVANLSDIRSIKSTFLFRTFDPEGTVFYGDTKGGEDWFVLSLMEGFALMQINKGNILVSVKGGPKLNDGKWHRLELSSQGKFVIMEVDGSNALEVGLEAEDVMTGEIRLAIGGILVDANKLFISFVPDMDACLRDGSWLSLTTPWQTDMEELWPCYQDIRPGSYFPGNGFAVFNTTVFPSVENGVKIEMWGDFSQMEGTILSVRSIGEDPILVVAASNNTEMIRITFGEENLFFDHNIKQITIIIKEDMYDVLTGAFLSQHTTPEGAMAFFSTWRDTRLAIGGLLGEGEDDGGSQYLSGCLEKIEVQGKNVDLDLSLKHPSISSHSCPA